MCVFHYIISCSDGIVEVNTNFDGLALNVFVLDFDGEFVVDFLVEVDLRLEFLSLGAVPRDLGRFTEGSIHTESHPCVATVDTVVVHFFTGVWVGTLETPVNFGGEGEVFVLVCFTSGDKVVGKIGTGEELDILLEVVVSSEQHKGVGGLVSFLLVISNFVECISSSHVSLDVETEPEIVVVGGELNVGNLVLLFSLHGDGVHSLDKRSCL